MKRVLLFIQLLGLSKLALAQASLISKNLEVNSIRYEYQLHRTDENHVMFRICTVTAPVSCKESKSYLNEFDKNIFDLEFKTILSTIDANLATYLVAAPANLAAFNTVRDELHKLSKGKSGEKTPQQKEIEELKTRLKEVQDEKPEQDSIGKLKMMMSDVKVFDNKGQVKRTSRVKEIEILIVRGSIAKRRLKVTLIDGTDFFNEQSPVSFPIFYRRKKDNLVRYDGRNDSSLHVKLGDVLDFNFFSNLNYPSDGIIILNQEKPEATLRIGSSLNNLITVTAYTDLLGLLGRKANGLIQTEIAGNFITNSGNWKNTDIVFHNFMQPYIRLSKFDSKFASLDSNNIKPGPNKKDTVIRTYLNQITYLQAGLKVNVIHLGIGINQAIKINLGTDINLVSADSLYGRDIIFFNYYPEFNYTVNRLKNFGMDCSIRFLHQRISDNSDILNKGFIWVFNPQITLNYFTSSKEENKMFFRFGYFDNLKDSKYNFAQFQIGYKTSLKLN
jgi:hypothetical protein